MAPMDSRATDVAAPRGLRGATADRTTMARTLAYLFAAGAALAFLSIALPGALEVPKPVLGVAIAVAAMTATVSAALAMRGAALLRGFLFQLGLAAATAVVTAAVWADGPGSRYALFYVLIALYSAYFFTRVQTAVQVMLALSAYAVAELARHPSGGDFARWLLTAGVIAVATTLVFALEGAARGRDHAPRGGGPHGRAHRPAQPARLHRDLRDRARTRQALRAGAQPDRRRPRPLQGAERHARPRRGRRRARAHWRP